MQTQSLKMRDYYVALRSVLQKDAERRCALMWDSEEVLKRTQEELATQFDHAYVNNIVPCKYSDCWPKHFRLYTVLRWLTRSLDRYEAWSQNREGLRIQRRAATRTAQ